MQTRRDPLAVTHDGSFHADEVFGFVVLNAALGPTLRLRRSRDPAVIAAADIVFDVGGSYDPASGRYDHHMRDRPQRADSGLPYSSAGLLWRDFGRDALRAQLGAATPVPIIDAIWREIDDTLVRTIDAVDNGVTPPEATSLALLVDACKPTWDVPAHRTAEAETQGFHEAADLVAGFLRRRADHIRATLAAHELVLAAFRASPIPEILELPHNLPWQPAVFQEQLPVLYAVYPKGGNWMIDAMPPAPGSFAQRLPLPERWAGLRDAALSAECGVFDAVFVHPARFCGSARSRSGALAMAEAALAFKTG